MTFNGYRRPDGKAGIRNHVLVLPVSVCASETARMVAEQVDGAVYIPNQGGCAQVERDLQILVDTLSGLAANPNVYGTVMIALGCEGAQADMVEKAIREKTNKPLEVFVIQQVGGTVKTAAAAVKAAKNMAVEAAALEREPCGMHHLLLGTECGGSDPTSGLAANPVMGLVSDRLVADGASVILSETTEFIGAEDILAKRCATPQVAGDLYRIVQNYEKHIAAAGEDLRGANPTPGNKQGGITTLEEKSLGCIHKGGHTVINQVVAYAQSPTGKGLVVMDTPGQDIASIAGMAAGGAQVVIFSTGRGTPTGFPIAPVIKITGNPHTFATMMDNIDFDASGVISETATMEQLGDGLHRMLMDVVNGGATKAETLGFGEMSVARLCNFV